MPARQFAAWRFFRLTGDPARSSQWLTNSIGMNPDAPAQYFLAQVPGAFEGDLRPVKAT